jgi:hypothetical protein
MTLIKRPRQEEGEIIAYDDERMAYYYAPWEKTGETIRTDKYNDYVDIWHIRLTHLEWWSEKAPTHGVAGFKIWGSQWEIQELLDLYSPTKDNKIELIKAWDFDPDVYTITLLNTGEKNEQALGKS